MELQIDPDEVLEIVVRNLVISCDYRAWERCGFERKGHVRRLTKDHSGKTRCPGHKAEYCWEEVVCPKCNGTGEVLGPLGRALLQFIEKWQKKCLQ